jgi:hypothetical protein
MRRTSDSSMTGPVPVGGFDFFFAMMISGIFATD